MTELIVTEIGMLLAFIVGYIFGKNSRSNTNSVVGKIKMTKSEKKAQQDKKDDIIRRNEELQITLDNINNYNGSAIGQKDYKS